MDAGLLDVLEDAAEEDLHTVEDRVAVDLDRALEEAVDQHRMRRRDVYGPRYVAFERRLLVDDLHRPAPEHVGGPDQDRIPDRVRHRARLAHRSGDAVGWVRQAQVRKYEAEPLAILGAVDRIRRGPEDRDTGGL